MYNKLFSKIVDSSIWLEPAPTRIVFLTFLAVMDETGFVELAAVGNVANRARVTCDEAQAALARLENPDQESGDPEFEGRRVERVPGGWMVLNAEKYRRLVTRVLVKEQTRTRVKRWREKKRDRNAPVTPCNAPVTAHNARVTPSDTDTEVLPTKNVGSARAARPDKPADPRVKEFIEWFQGAYATHRRGAKYLVTWAKHGKLVKSMLGAVDLPELKELAVMMLKEEDDEFIGGSDHGIEILKGCFNLLSDSRAEYLARHKPK